MNNPALWNGGWCPCGHEEGEWRDARDWKVSPAPSLDPNAPPPPVIYGAALNCRACGATYVEAWRYREGGVEKLGNMIVAPDDSLTLEELEEIFKVRPPRRPDRRAIRAEYERWRGPLDIVREAPF